jgi:transposase-like protein
MGGPAGGAWYRKGFGERCYVCISHDHQKFGYGTITATEDDRLEVDFDKADVRLSEHRNLAATKRFFRSPKATGVDPRSRRTATTPWERPWIHW